MTASDLTVGPARRGVLASAVGAAGAAALAGWTAGAPHPAANDPGPDPRLAAAGATRPFRGARQAGIADSPQTYAAFVALDLAGAVDATVVRRLLTVLTDDIDRLMAGRGPLTDQEPELAGVPAALTLTVGIRACPPP